MFTLARITKNTFLTNKNSYTMPNLMYQPLGLDFHGFDQKWSSFCPGNHSKWAIVIPDKQDWGKGYMTLYTKGKG